MNDTKWAKRQYFILPRVINNWIWTVSVTLQAELVVPWISIPSMEYNIFIFVLHKFLNKNAHQNPQEDSFAQTDVQGLHENISIEIYY